MKIGLLGSFFNPPHLGHLLAAWQVLDYTDINQIWLLPSNKRFLPAYNNLNNETISLNHRLNMVNLLKLSRTLVSTLEIDYNLSGNTIELVPLLKRIYPKDKFVFIIGSDWLPGFHKWGRHKELVKLMEFLVVPRAGYVCKPLYPNMTVLKHKNLILTNISSSMIRERVKNKLSIDNFVPEAVKEYIIKNNLYQ